jgi:hypothetical protein
MAYSRCFVASSFYVASIGFFMSHYLDGIDELLILYCLFEMFNAFDFLYCMVYFRCCSSHLLMFHLSIQSSWLYLHGFYLDFTIKLWENCCNNFSIMVCLLDVWTSDIWYCKNSFASCCSIQLSCYYGILFNLKCCMKHLYMLQQDFFLRTKLCPEFFYRTQQEMYVVVGIS